MKRKMRKLWVKSFCAEPILKCVCIIAVIGALYSTFTMGRAFLHSDSATVQLLVNSILTNKSLIPSSWNYANGEIWFFDIHWPYFLTNIFFKDKTLSRCCSTAILLGILLCTFLFFSKKMVKDYSYLLAIPMLLLFVGGTETRDLILYEGAYLFIFSLLLIVPSLYYKTQDYFGMNEKKLVVNWKYYIPLFGLLLLFQISGIRYVAEIVLPLLGACLIDYLVIYREKNIYKEKLFWKQLGVSLSVIMIPSVVGDILYNKISQGLNVNKNEAIGFELVSSVSEIGKNILLSLKNLYEVFGYYGNTSVFSHKGIQSLISLVFCTLVCFIVPVLQAIRVANERSEVRFFYCFGMLHNIEIIATAILFGKSKGYWLISTVFVFIVISSIYIYNHWIERSINWKYLLEIVFSLLVIVEVLCLYKDGQVWKDRLANQLRVCNELESRGLNKGYASFWNAYTYEVYSNGNIRMGTVEYGEQVWPWLWLVDSKVYAEEDHNSFVLLNTEEMTKHADMVWNYLGDPVEDFVINDVDLFNEFSHDYYKDNLYVLVYDHDVARDINNGVMDGQIPVHEMKFNWLGTEKLENNGIVAYLDNGGYIKGPFSMILPGKYIVTYHGRNLDAGTYEIYSETNNNGIKYNIESVSDSEVVFELDIDCYIYDIIFGLKNETDEIIEFYLVNVDEMN